MSNEFKLYVSAAGDTRRRFLPVCKASSLQDAAEQEVWCDYAEARSWKTVRNRKASTQQSARPYFTSGWRCVLIFAPQSFVAAIFSVSREERRAARYRGSTRSAPNADLLRDIDDETERRGITLCSASLTPQ